MHLSGFFSRGSFLFFAFATAALAQVTDPRITSWQTAKSAQYARVYESAAKFSSGTTVTTWPTSGLVTSPAGGVATAAYADVQRVAYSANYVYIQTTGLASYTMGNWLTPNGTTYTSFPSNRAAIHRFPRTPTIPTTKQKNNGSGGVLVNGVYVWQNGDAQSYANASSTTSTATISMTGDGIWNRLAGVAETFNFDPANGHQPSSGAYHNHVNPKALRYQLGDNVTYNATAKTYSEAATPTKHSPIIGWANDGLPIYGPYGYATATDATSGLRRMTSGFVKRNSTNAALYGTDDLAVTGRIKLPVWAASVQGRSQTLTSTQYGPTTTATYAQGPVTYTCSIGLFSEDYEYLGDLGKTQGVDFDLNRQNVRFCVTPEFPSGTYAYFVCIDASGNTVFPDVINQEYFGTAPAGQGTVTSITESVTEYVDAGPAAAITLTGAAAGSNVALSWNSAEGATYKVESSTDNATYSTLSAAVTSGGLTTNYTAAGTANYYRVTLTAIATYDTGGTYGTPVGKTATLTYGTATATAPAITTQPVAVTVTAGASATFAVVASGTAPLSYQWYKGVSAISGATSASYTIATTVAGDAGSYSVVVTNTAGSATSNGAALTVNAAAVAPAITTQPVAVTVTAGTSATFSVVASGTAPLSYQWYKGVAAISGATSASYTIATTVAGDAGSYSVVVTNTAGSATSNGAALTVNAAPVAPAVTTQPVAVTVTAGASATFSVVASGTAPLSYQWYKGVSAISGATSASYTIATTVAGDAGSYSVVVTNTAGSATSNGATLTVNPAAVAPAITTQPVAVTVTAGASATFSVVASGTAPLSYQWYKGVSAIPGATSASYTIATTVAGDAGSYSVVVTNTAGSATSNGAALTVNAAAVAPAVTTQPLAVTVTAGASATFSVVASGTAPLSYQWYKGVSAISGATSASYTITTTVVGDAASFSVVVTNTAGSATSNGAALTVNPVVVAPAITTQPVAVTVTAGASATFTVVASGTAPLSYQWYKGVSAISGATSASYTIAATVAGDAGSYSVVVTNTAGSATSNGAALTVNPAAVAPAIATQPVAVTITAGASATFSVVASGTAPLSYQWYKGVSAISGATNASYVIAAAALSDVGSYSVVATNSAGAVTSAAATLTISSTGGVDPRLSSWSTGASGKYARLYDSDAAKSAGTVLTTWSRGSGAQSSPSYAGVMQVSSSADYVYLRSSGLGYHVMGPWYLNAAHTQNFPNFPANQNVLYRVPRNPTVPASKTLTPGGAIGYGVDGVAIFDSRDTFSYSTAGGQDAEPVNGLTGTGVWNRDAYFNESVTFDPAFAHQAGSNYHYHANTPALRYLLGDHVDYVAATKTYAESTAAVAKHSPIIGWMADGFPIYGPYGYATATEATSGLRRMVSGFVKRDGTNGTTNLTATGRTTLPAWAARAQGRSATLASTQYGPAVSATYAIGRYLEDFDYLGELGKTQGVDFDLDLHNGRFCVTPEFPGGTYAYFVSIESDGTPKFPYLVGRWFYGSPVGGAVTSVTETVTEYVRAGPTGGLGLTATAAGTGAGVVLAWASAEGATYKVEASSDNATWTTVAAAVTSAGTATTYTAATPMSFYRVTLTAIATYDTRAVVGTPVGTTATASFDVPVTAPAITTQPAAVTVTAGASATFSVVASGTAPLSYQWSKGAMAIAGATSASYTIATTVVGDAGTYSVVVTNAAGSATSAAAALTVNQVVVAPAITTQPVAVTVTAGASATFTVVASGTAPLSYQWSKGATVIAGATSASYAIAATVVGDAGTYSVVVTNAAGSATSAAATLTVNLVVVAPAITTQPVAVTVTAGASATFSVVASGTAPLSYQWSKGATVIAGATSASYTIAATVAGDAGSYSVVVTNAADSATSAAATLTVNPVVVAPAITTQPVAVTLTAGASATFSAVASGTAPLNYQWKKDGATLVGATAASLALTGVQVADAGSYAVVVTNTAGAVTSAAAELTVASATHAVFGHGYVAGGTVTLTANAAFTGAPTRLSWQVLLPTGWTYAGGTATGAATVPVVGAGELAEWVWTTVPTNPVTWQCTFNVPTGTVGATGVSAVLAGRRADGTTWQVLAQPEPLAVAAAPQVHSADSDKDGRISLFELTRVIELYNARDGSVRTGKYRVQAGSEDGFAPMAGP